MKAKRTKHSSSLKARVAIEALQERESISELARRYEIHPNMINKWKKEFLECAPDVFSKPDTRKSRMQTWRNYTPKSDSWRWKRNFLKKT